MPRFTAYSSLLMFNVNIVINNIDNIIILLDNANLIM